MIDLKTFCEYLQSFAYISRTPVSCAIVAMPFLLLIAMLHFLVINSDDQVGAVVSNAAGCAAIGRGVLREGGSVVDAAITTMLCEGIFIPDRAGIGGGFSAIMYINGKFDTISAIARAPANFSDAFFKLNPLPETLAAAIPGELLGYWSMHQKYGLLPWKQLFAPIIRTCNIKPNKCINQERAIFKIKCGNEYAPISSIHRTLLKTLERIANEGVDVFYKGEIGKMFAEDVLHYGGVMTENDLRNYRVTWNPRPITFNIRPKKMAYTTPLPSSGAIVALVMNVIKNYPNKTDAVFWHHIVEALKYGYRYSYELSDIENEPNEDVVRHVKDIFEKMIDPDFARSIRYNISQHVFKADDFPGKFRSYYTGGTSNICILAPNGDAIAITTTLQAKEGTLFASPRTGVILNNEMYNFRPLNNETATPPFTWPGRRPITAHCPTIIVKRLKAEVHFIVGATGYNSAAAQVVAAISKYCLHRSSVTHTANTKFFHPDILKNIVYYRSNPLETDEEDAETLRHLKRMGHNLKTLPRSESQNVRSCIGHMGSNSDADYTRDEEGSIELLSPKHKFNSMVLFMFLMLIFMIVTIFGYEVTHIDSAALLDY